VSMKLFHALKELAVGFLFIIGALILLGVGSLAVLVLSIFLFPLLMVLGIIGIILQAFLGILVVVLLVWLIGKLVLFLWRKMR
jgi:hypothetical protein